MKIQSTLTVISCLVLAAGCSTSPRGGTESYPDNSAATTKGMPGRVHMGGSPHVDATVPTAGAAIPLTDAQFVIQAAQMGMAEVRMGELGVRRAEDEEVRDLAAHLVDDHARANTELAALAARKGYKVPSEVGPTEQAILSSLTEVDRPSFDDRFRQAAQQSHQRALRAYRVAAAHVSDPDLRAFAQKQVPILEHHLAMSQRVETGTAVGGSAPDSF